MNSYRIRQAEPSDCQAVEALEKTVFGRYAYPLAFYRQAHDICSAFFLVAESDDGAVAGHIIGGYAAGEKDAWIMSIAVGNDHRRQGIAKALMADLLEILAERGAERVLLTVDPSNNGACRAYENEGFSEVEMVEDYFGPGETRIVMGKDIKK